MRSALALALCLVFGAKAGSGDRGALPPDPPADRDSAASERSLEFETAAMDASAFAEAARRDGITVSPGEVKRRVDFYKTLYPGRQAEPGKVESIMLAEKYLERKGMLPDGAEPDGMHRLLAREDVQREAGKLEDLARIQLASEQEPRTLWPRSDLQVQGDPEECLAWAGGNCLVPLREYNAATVYYPMPGGMPLDSAKAIILKRYLAEKRLAAEAREEGLDRKADSLLPRIKGEKDDFIWMQSAIPFGTPLHDARSLEETYGKYYGRYFGPRENITLGIIGSSDSVYIDSLYRVFGSWDRKRAANRKAGLPEPKEPALPWSYFKDRQVSRDLAALTDSLQAGQCAPPYRSPLGHYLVRLVKAIPIRAISFDEAHFRLVYLATRDKFLGMDSVVEALARKHYAANLARYAWPDTLALRAWLIPRPEPRASAPAVRKGKTPAVADTARFRSMEISSLSLPPDLRIVLQGRVTRDSGRGFFGPLTDRYGRWYFQLRSRKPARGVLPFRLARKDILDRLAAPPEEEGSGMATEEAEDEVGANLALANALRQVRLQKSREERQGVRPTEGDADLPHSVGLTGSDQEKAVAAAVARIRAEEAKQREEEARLLKEARVDLGRLFR